MATQSMIDIGDKLKKAREHKNLTIDQAQKQTNIHSTVLIALEEGRCDEILTSTYVKSFLKKYTQFLGISAKEILDEYTTLNGSTRYRDTHEDAPSIAKEKVDSATAVSIASKEKVIKVLLGAIVVVVLFVVGSSAIKLISAHVKQSASAKKASGTDRAKTAKTKETSKRKQTRGKTQSNRAQQIIPNSVPLKIVIKVKSPVWVELKKDGEPLFKRVLPKDLVETITANEKVEFLAARGDALEIILNGRLLEPLPKSLVKNVEITRSGIRIK